MARSVGGLCLPVEYLVLGMLDNNTYIIGGEETGGVMVVDPSCDVERILDAIGERTVIAIVLTHHHWDHVGAAAALREATGAPTIASAIDAPVIVGEQPYPGDRPYTPCPIDQTVAHGDTLHVGTMTWQVIGTPGHTPGSICLYTDPQDGTNPSGTPILVSGDTLFCGAIGRTDFPGGSMADMRNSLKLLAELSDRTNVLTGHNELTTIRIERIRILDRFAI